ncbi:MAG: hypothetical protein KGN32_16665 [Burkholderiales bacterium]|nr:hypothetical protein [Burkholderiales bacterium]
MQDLVAGPVQLHIGALETEVRVGPAAAPTATMVLAMGTQQIADAFFRRMPPTRLQVENAIQLVEDEVVRARTLAPAGTWICSADDDMRAIAALAGESAVSDRLLSLEDVEHTFNRWVDWVEGRPASQDDLPKSASFAARLLILRECMHHLQVHCVRLI